MGLDELSRKDQLCNMRLEKKGKEMAEEGQHGDAGCFRIMTNVGHAKANLSIGAGHATRQENRVQRRYRVGRRDARISCRASGEITLTKSGEIWIPIHTAQMHVYPRRALACATINSGQFARVPPRWALRDLLALRIHRYEGGDNCGDALCGLGRKY